MYIKKYIRKSMEFILSKYNYKVIPDNFMSWPHHDKGFKLIFNKQKKFGWKDHNVIKINKMYKVYQLLDLVRDIDGNWAECGVYRGSTAFLLGSYNKKYKILKNTNKIFLFDSFEGLSKPTKNDVGTFLHEKNYRCSEKEVKNNLKQFDFFVYRNDWIPFCFKNDNNKKFSFVHIDVDLYEPIKDSLKFFEKKMKKGGIIVMDDYGFNGTPGATLATDTFVKKNHENFYFWKLPYGQAVFIKK